jgi:hypothetical protein
MFYRLALGVHGCYTEQRAKSWNETGSWALSVKLAVTRGSPFMGKIQAMMWIWNSIHTHCIYWTSWSKLRNANMHMVCAIVLRWSSECPIQMAVIMHLITHCSDRWHHDCKCNGQQLLETHNARSSDSFSSTNGSSGKWLVPLSAWASLVYILVPGDGKWEFIMGTKPAVADPFEESMADCNFFNCDFRHTKVTFES